MQTELNIIIALSGLLIGWNIGEELCERPQPTPQLSPEIQSSSPFFEKDNTTFPDYMNYKDFVIYGV
jgi:hypothetical protein